MRKLANQLTLARKYVESEFCFMGNVISFRTQCKQGQRGNTQLTENRNSKHTVRWTRLQRLQGVVGACVSTHLLATQWASTSPGILEFNEGERGPAPSVLQIDISYRPVFVEHVLHVFCANIRGEISNIDPAVVVAGGASHNTRHGSARSLANFTVTVYLFCPTGDPAGSARPRGDYTPSSSTLVFCLRADIEGAVSLRNPKMVLSGATVISTRRPLLLFLLRTRAPPQKRS